MRRGLPARRRSSPPAPANRRRLPSPRRRTRRRRPPARTPGCLWSRPAPPVGSHARGRLRILEPLRPAATGARVAEQHRLLGPRRRRERIRTRRAARAVTTVPDNPAKTAADSTGCPETRSAAAVATSVVALRCREAASPPGEGSRATPPRGPARSPSVRTPRPEMPAATSRCLSRGCSERSPDSIVHREVFTSRCDRGHTAWSSSRDTCSQSWPHA